MVQTAANQQPGVATAPGGAVYTETITQNARTTGAALVQFADNGPAGLEIELNNAPGSVINEDITQTATGVAATNIVQGGTGPGGAPAYNSAMILGTSAGSRIEQDVTQRANGGAAVTQNAANGGLGAGLTVYTLGAGFGGARIDGANSVITQNINQNVPAPGAAGVVIQTGASYAIPNGNGDRVTQTGTQTAVSTLAGAGVAVIQIGGNWQDANAVPFAALNDQVTTQSFTQTGTVPGAAGSTVAQDAAQFASSIGTNNRLTQTIAMDGTGHTVAQGTVATSWNEVRTFVGAPGSSAFVTQRNDQIARLPAGAGAGSLAFQTAWNNAMVFWAPGVTGSLTQSLNQTAAHAIVVQPAWNV
jgi:hypothetical protein